jgi:uncharacterized protein involved in exopolysaccharide biosynthesis
MKNNIGFVLLALLAVILAVALVAIRQQAVERQKNDAATILDFSNQWSEASLKVDEFGQVNLALHNDLATNRALLADLSNSLTTVSVTMTNLGNSLAAAQSQIASQSTRITDLQQQNKELNDRAAALTSAAAELTNRIASLNGQINDTIRQLAGSKTNNAYLEIQLQHLILARAELEHKFETLASVREQLRKLEDDAYTARRLRWMKEGTDVSMKGGPLMVKFRDRGVASGGDDDYGLHVELGSDGSIRTVPLNADATNNVNANSAPR